MNLCNAVLKGVVRPLGRGTDRVEYLGEREALMGREYLLEQARRECWDKERWGLSTRERFRRERGVRIVGR